MNDGGTQVETQQGTVNDEEQNVKRKYADTKDSEVNALRQWDFLHSINSANIRDSFGPSG